MSIIDIVGTIFVTVVAIAAVAIFLSFVDNRTPPKRPTTNAKLERLILDPREPLIEVVQEAERQAVREFRPEKVNQY